LPKDYGASLIFAPHHKAMPKPEKPVVEQLAGAQTKALLKLKKIGRVLAQFWQSRLVAKIQPSDNANIRRTAVAKGRKSLAKMYPEAAAMARNLRRKRKARMSLRAIAAELEVHGYLNERGRPFNPKSIASMLRQLRREPGGAMKNRRPRRNRAQYAAKKARKLRNRKAPPSGNSGA
jgi:hypothetical protein